MPITKVQARNNQAVESWLYDQPYRATAKAAPAVPDLTADQVHEYFTPVRSRELGAFFTPREVAQKAFNYIAAYAPANPKILDPCAGIGMLGAVGYDYLVGRSEITAVEVDRQHYDIGRKLYPKWTWHHGNAFYMDLPTDYDIVVLNPPYNVYTDAPDNYVSSKSEHRFLELALRCVRPGGQVAVLAPYNFYEKRPKPLVKLCEEHGVELMHQERLGGGFAQTSVQVELFLFQRGCARSNL